MKRLLIFLIFAFAAKASYEQGIKNPFLPDYTQPVDFAAVTPASIGEAAQYILAEAERQIQEIIQKKENERNYDNTILAIDRVWALLLRAQLPFDLMVNVHPDKAVRDTASACFQQVTTFMEGITLHETLYNALRAYTNSAEAKTLKGERAYFLKKTLHDFERNGLTLPPLLRDSLKEINKKILETSFQFHRNITSDNSFVLMTEAELEGMSDDYRQERIQPDGTYKVDMSYPSYIPFLTYAKNAEARKKVYLRKMNTGMPKNIPLLEQLIILRDTKAKLLGYKSYAAFMADDQMAKTPANVWDFEKKLTSDVRSKADTDYQAMLEVKSRELGKKETAIYPYDSYYYYNKILEEKYKVNSDHVKEYFEIQNVIRGIFEVYQRIYNLSFVEDKSPSVWHKDVQAFSVYDKHTNKRIGYFFLDLYPRENKYNHAACWELSGAYMTPKGRNLGVAALVCNFPKPTLEKPSLMPHKEVVTFFHEFGHAMHNLLSETEMASLAGVNVPRDFVEAPSQIMENWVWDKKVLSLFARHYKTGEVIPDDLLNRMIEARNLNSGVLTLQQIFYGTLDYTLHDGYQPSAANPISMVVKTIQNSVTLYPYVEGGHFESGFGHLIGYGAGYYGYLWSQVYAQDMFSVFEQIGVLSPEAGMKYRREILAKGGSDEAINLVKNFLGREPNNKAFLKSLGLNPQ